MFRIQGQQGTVRVYTVEQGGRAREEWREGAETTANRLRRGNRQSRTNSSFTLAGGGEGISLRRSNDSKHRGRVRKWRTEKRGTREGGSVGLRTRAEECQSLPAGRERLQVFICVMRSGYEARRRGGGGRGSSARRGGVQGTAVRTQSVFCCHGSSAAGEERYLSIRRSCHRYVPAQEPVSPVYRLISVSRLARGKTERVCYVVWKHVHRSRCHLGKTVSPSWNPKFSVFIQFDDIMK